MNGTNVRLVHKCPICHLPASVKKYSRRNVYVPSKGKWAWAYCCTSERCKKLRKSTKDYMFKIYYRTKGGVE